MYVNTIGCNTFPKIQIDELFRKRTHLRKFLDVTFLRDLCPPKSVLNFFLTSFFFPTVKEKKNENDVVDKIPQGM